jgi:hypothetical protein
MPNRLNDDGLHSSTGYVKRLDAIHIPDGWLVGDCKGCGRLPNSSAPAFEVMSPPSKQAARNLIKATPSLARRPLI